MTDESLIKVEIVDGRAVFVPTNPEVFSNKELKNKCQRTLTMLHTAMVYNDSSKVIKLISQLREYINMMED